MSIAVRIDENMPDEDVCPICWETYDNKKPEHQLECGHSFHCSCIVKWFRSGNLACPCCRAVPQSTGFANFRDRRSRLRLMMRLANRKDAPVALKKLVAKKKEITRKRMEKVKKYRQWKKSIAGKLFRQLLAIDRKGRRCRYSFWRFDKTDNDILNFPIVPVFMSMRRNHRSS